MQLAFWATALATGIALGIATGHSAVIVCVAGLAACAVLVFVRAWNLALALLALLCGAWLGRQESARALAPPAVEEDRLCEVIGQVVRGADVSEEPPPVFDGVSSEGPIRAGRRCHLRVDLASVDGKPIRGTVALTVLDGVPNVAPGDWIGLSSRLYAPRGFANPGLPDARLLARGQGIDLLATVRSPDDIRRVPGPPAALGLIRRAAFRLRQVMANAINQALPGPVAGFVRTMVIGERTDVPPLVEDGFRAAGATHVLSVSGLHLAVVVALVFHVLRWSAARFAWLALRLPPKVLAAALALPACLFYTLLTGEAVATVRSAIMAGVVLGATVVNRPLSLAASIAAAAILLLIGSPLALLDVSFQLSFASVMGLGLFARWLLPRGQDHTPTGRLGRVGRWLLRSFSASLAASLVTMPIVAHHFGEITPAAPIGNLVLVPLVELLVLPCGLIGALLALVHPSLGMLPLIVAGFASRLALTLAELFRQAAPVLLVEFPTWTETLLLVAGVACLLRVLARGTANPRRWLALATASLVAAGASLFAREVQRLHRDFVVVTFIDVGQGDAALVEGPRGFSALVDAGGRYDNSLDTGARIIEPFLRSRGITRLDAVILSHPHPDHMNGLFRVLKRFPVATLWTHGDDGRNPAYRELVQLAKDKAIPMPVPSSLAYAGLLLEALGPRLGDAIGVPPGLGVNDASLVVRLSFAGRRVLFVGDIGSEGEAELLDRGTGRSDVLSDVLKIPHHGSRYASSEVFVDAVAPKLAVASAGRFNRFGLPNPIALERYARRGIEVLRTDRDGAACITIVPSGAIQVATAEHNPQSEPIPRPPP
jgi:competence protein ComEC